MWTRLRELDGECEFVKDIAVWYPIRVIMSILGVPESDEPLMMKLTQELFGSADPDTRRSFENTALMEVVEDFNTYFRELTQARRENPTDDIASVIANAKSTVSRCLNLKLTVTTPSSQLLVMTRRVLQLPAGLLALIPKSQSNAKAST